MDNDGVVERLDRILSVLRIAHADKITQLGEALREHPVDAAVLEEAVEWTNAGQLKKTVAEKSGQSERNVLNRLAALVELGVLERKGSARATTYRSTGLF